MIEPLHVMWARFHLAGRVVHVEPGTPGPIVRSRTHQLVRWTVFLVLLPMLIIAVALARLTVHLVGSMAGNKPGPRRPGLLADSFGDLSAHLVAKRLSSVGQTLITSARIRDSAGQVFPVRIEGHFIRGAFTQGDRVTLLLRIVDGVNIVAGGENHSTREDIRIHR